MNAINSIMYYFYTFFGIYFCYLFLVRMSNEQYGWAMFDILFAMYSAHLVSKIRKSRTN